MLGAWEEALLPPSSSSPSFPHSSLAPLLLPALPPPSPACLPRPPRGHAASSAAALIAARTAPPSSHRSPGPARALGLLGEPPLPSGSVRVPPALT